MLSNYIAVSIRNLVKDKLYTLINALGLAVAIATCYFIFSWVKFETTYDTFHNSGNLYRLATQWDNEPSEGYATAFPMVRTRVLSEFPEVEESARVFNTSFLGSKTSIVYQTHINTNSVLYYADSTFFKIFPANFIDGAATVALAKPNAIVLTSSLALKLFGNENPIGKLVTIGDHKSFEVTGIISDWPVNSHMHFDMIASMESHPWIQEAEQSVWSGISFHTYVRLKKGASAKLLQQKINNLFDHFPDDPKGFGKTINAVLQPVQSIHLTSHLKSELLPNGDSRIVYLFITIALLVLVVAIVNYINLSTARYTQRFKEVGVRKVMGANRLQLMTQFISESLTISIAALLLSIVLIESFRPLLISIASEKYFSLKLYDITHIIPFLLSGLIIGIVSGFFPALLLSGIQPVKLFKPSFDSALKGTTLRKGLVVFQFAISIILTICTATTFQQIQFLKNESTGYNREQVVVVPIGYTGVKEKYELLKSTLETLPTVDGVAFTSQLPTNVQTAENIDLPDSRQLGVYYLSVDPQFFSTLGIDLHTDKSLLSKVVPNDSIHYFAINESALQSIGWTSEQALNSKISIRHGNQQLGAIVAVIKNFHFQSMHSAIQPLVIEFTPSDYEYMLVKVNSGDVQQTLKSMETSWKNLAGSIPFDYSFLDENYRALYQHEQLTGDLFTAFSIIALSIALLGLFGLASFAVTKRTKEIGIRKILGAEFKNILLLLTKDFGFLLLVALVLSVPVGYYFQREWLSGFAYRTEIGISLFVMAGLVNLTLAFMTIAYHCIRASKVNTVETLRNE